MWPRRSFLTSRPIVTHPRLGVQTLTLASQAQQVPRVLGELGPICPSATHRVLLLLGTPSGKGAHVFLLPGP